MNLNSLFTKQQLLDDHIVEEKGLQGQDLLKKKTVALICELYECVNEARFFKFWSENHKPRTYVVNPDDECDNCKGKAYFNQHEKHTKDWIMCEDCDGVGFNFHNPLLEEYSDLIHFTLSIANDLGYHEHKYIKTHTKDLNDLVIGITNIATIIPMSREKHHVSELINNVIQLGYQLGFTEQDVLNAYDDKNKENHARQVNGY